MLERNEKRAPFTTSTLQQKPREAGIPAHRLIQIAQQLYEGLEIGPQGTTGLITYIRTDSVRVAAEAESSARSFIKDVYGKDYIPDRPRRYKKKATSQDAHEAIRPTLVTRRPEDLKKRLSGDQYRLYKLSGTGFCKPNAIMVLDTVRVDIKAKNYLFELQASG